MYTGHITVITTHKQKPISVYFSNTASANEPLSQTGYQDVNIL